MTNAAAIREASPVSAVPAAQPELNTIRQHIPLTLDAVAMNSMVRLSEIMATGKATVPQEYRGNPGDCLAVVMQAVQWRMNPYAVAQKTYFVSGKIGYEAQLINAVINSLAPTEDRIHYEWYGPWDKVIGKFEIKKGDKGEYRVPGWKLADEEGIGVRVWATIKGEREPRTLDLLLAQARTRNSTLWADAPRQQLAYLAVKRWARLYTPDVIMGVYSPDELEEAAPSERDMGAAEVVRAKLGNGTKTPPLRDVLAMIAQATTPAEMDAAKAETAKISGESTDGKKARQAWKERFAELKAAAKKPEPADDNAAGAGEPTEVTDEQTGEITRAGDSGAPAVDYDALRKELQNAATMDDLGQAATLIGQIPDIDRQNTLAEIYQARAAELNAPKKK